MRRIWTSVAVSIWVLLGVVFAQESAAPDGRFVRKPASTPSASARPVAESSGKGPASRLATPRASVSPAVPVQPLPVLPAKDGTRQHKRLVCRLKSVPAMDLAKTLSQLLQAEGRTAPGATTRSVVIVPDAVSNSLVIAGPVDAVGEVRELVEQLDYSAGMDSIEVAIGDAPLDETRPAGAKPPAKAAAGKAASQLHQIEKPKNMEIAVRARLMTMDNQPAFLHVGRREPRVTGTTVSQSGTVNQVQLENVGTILGVTPRIAPDGTVAMEIDVEDSCLGPPQEGTPVITPKEGQAARTPNIETMTAQTSLQISDGQTVVLGGMARQAKTGKQRLIVVTPHVIRIGL
jgi:type II secretory pathway component GspD/PulD (secretin)